MGHCIDHYNLEELVARTGTASVYRGTDLNTGSQVAIKIPHLEAESDVTYFERFQRENRICQDLDHPGVVRALGDRQRTRLYMVTNWVDGRPLRQVLSEQGRLKPERAVRIAISICEALGYLHGRGVVHRDLKPENILLGPNDEVTLIDFGIAWKVGERRLTFGALSHVMGTADYIAPEQVKGKRGDCRSDFYSLGIVLYEMLSGEMPFEATNALAMMSSRLHMSARPLNEVAPDVPEELQAVVAKALERDSSRRYSSAAEFAHSLEHPDEAAGTGMPPAGKPFRVLLHSMVTAASIAVLGVLFYAALHP